MQGRKPDWTAGNIDIPRFHCPRCRDHWYGIAEFPCDEELARLIREGLWFTGKEGAARSVREAKEMGSRGRQLGEGRDFTGNAGSGLPRIKHRGGMVGGRGEEERTVSALKEDGESDKKKKSCRRITFKLDDDSSNQSGGGTLDNTDRAGRSGGMTGTVSDTDSRSDSLLGNHKVDSGGGHGNTRPFGLHGNESDRPTGDPSVTDGLGSSGGRERKGDGGGGEGSETGLISGDSETKLAAARRRGKGRGRGRDGGSEGGGLLGSRGETTEDKTRKERGKKGLLQSAKSEAEDGVGSDVNVLESSGKSSLGDNNTGPSTQGILEGKHVHSIYIAVCHTVSSFLYINPQSTYLSVLSIPSGQDAGGASGQGRQDTPPDRTALSGRGSRTSLHSSSQGGRGVDHGKGVRKAAGHMRAASPSQSDWGDPYHARPYLSSTAASSRAGSTSNLHRDREEEEEEGGALPHIVSVPPISSKKPLLDLSDLLGGIQFTRAWTFSYHSHDPQTTRK